MTPNQMIDTASHASREAFRTMMDIIERNCGVLGGTGAKDRGMTDKPGLLAFLNKNAVEPVEIWPREPEPDTSDIPIASPEWFESASLTITDEAFDKFPLARQLHFAALAMENARACLKGEPA